MTLDRERVVAALPAYDIGQELGRGGWGIVLAGRHRQLGREVAIKELPRAFAADPAVRARFVAEARLLAGLDHPHVVPVYDFVETEGLCLLVMEKLTGGTLWSRFTDKGVTADMAVAAVMATCAALHFAHTRNILHRDIKPENIMFAATGALKVTDFGIAKVIGGSKTMATRAGEVLGTPAYMAPEQAQAKELSPATDVYATGVMLYELVSGRLPFEDDGDALALLYRHVFEQPIPLADVAPGLPAAITGVVMRSIATAPEKRYPSSEAFGVALAEAATDAWGTGWIGRGEVPVMAAGPITAVTERAADPGRRGRAKSTAADETVATALPTEPGLPVAAPSAANSPAPPTEAASPPAVPTETDQPVSAPAPPSITPAAATAPPRPSVVVRPVAPVHAIPAGAVDAAPRDVAPLDEVVERPPGPRPQILVAIALFLLAVVVAFVGAGEPERGGDLAVTVNGLDPSAPDGVPLDLGEPVVVAGPGLAGRVVLAFSVLGVEVGTAEADVTAAADGSPSATFDASSKRYLVAGEVTGEVRPATGADPSAVRSFAVRPAQSPLLTVPGGVAVALALFVLAYAESLLRSLRRGRKKVTATMGMAVIGALLGVTVVVGVWLAAEQEPVVATVAVCAALGLAAGLVAAVAARRVSQRRRFRVRAS